MFDELNKNLRDAGLIEDNTPEGPKAFQDYTIDPDYTIEGYDIRIEVREDEYVNYSIAYIREDGTVGGALDERVTLEFALRTITMHIRDHKAGAF